ncbi:hypothetical protein G6F60_014435 [Rhizopus arrhizus]|nr:hypothetical protein G6F60_014435 [Rhizopus arrhizus]
MRGKDEFAALAQGQLQADRPLIGVPRVANTLQQARQLQVLGKDASMPSGVRKIDSVPDLATMTRGALRFLQQRSSEGLFLMRPAAVRPPDRGNRGVQRCGGGGGGLD